jgi:hypothetical protein
MALDYTQEELRTVNARLANPCKELLDACRDKWKSTQPQTIPDILYHYTKAVIFQEILNSRTIWASDIRYMNDASEATYVSDILKSVIKEAKRSVHGDDECELLERISKTFDITEMLRVFALCFSEGYAVSCWSYGSHSPFATKVNPHCRSLFRPFPGCRSCSGADSRT